VAIVLVGVVADCFPAGVATVLAGVGIVLAVVAAAFLAVGIVLAEVEVA
jgi:hypothetical protein